MNPPPNNIFSGGIPVSRVASFLLLLAAAPLVAAQMQDGQDYPAATSTPVAGRSPWAVASSGGAATASTSFIGIYSGSLTGTTTPALAGLTNTINPEAHLQIARAGTSSRTYYRGVGASFTNGSVFFSFLMNVSVNSATNDEIVGEVVPAIPGGSYPANPTAIDPVTLHARQGVDTNHFNLGIQSLGGAVSWAFTSLADNTDYFVVLQYNFGAGQPGQLFINPVPGVVQPAANATAVKGATAEPANLGTILFWESSTNTSITCNFDVMRVDANWAAVTPAADVMRLLFLGNSLTGISATYSNNIPGILSQLAASLGDEIFYTSIANSSWLLADHATNFASTNAINSGNFDLVILQEKSETPSLPSDRDTLMFPACRTLNNLATNHAERTMFYETWAQINGDPNNNCNSYDIPPQYKTCDYPSFASFTSMNIAIRKAYATIGAELGAPISPVGLAWARVRTEQTNLNLYVPDDGFGDRHPNSYGAYLAACVFYGAVFGRSPEGSTYYSTNNISDAQYLQRIAAETVLTDPFASDAYGFGQNRYTWAYNWQNFTNQPTAPANTVIISGASAQPSPSVKVDANVGSISNLWLGTLDTNFGKLGQGRLYLSTNGALVVDGTLVVGKEGKGFVQHNGGTLTVIGTLTLAEQANSVGQYTLSNGTFYAAQVLRGNGSGAFNFQGGQLGFAQFGSASRPLDLANTSGTLALTNTTVTALIYGNFTNGIAATVSIWLGSTSNVLGASGTAALAGNLSIAYAPGFQATLGQQFTLLSAASVSGSFTNISLPTVGPDGLGLVTSLTSTSIVATVTDFTPGFGPAVLTNGNFQVALAGIAGNRYSVQTSTNLSAWTGLTTNIAPFTFIVSNLAADSRRFYRAVYLP